MRGKKENCLNGKDKGKSEEFAGKTPAGLSCEFYKFRPESFLTETFIDSRFELQISYLRILSTIAKKLPLERYNLEMAL